MSSLLILAGALLTALPLVAGPLGLSGAEFGTKQILFTIVGLAILSAGIERRFGTDSPRRDEPERQSLPPRRLFLLACWFGLLAGFGEDVAVAASHWLLGAGLSFNHHWFWMAPMANTMLFGLLASILALVARWWPTIGRIQPVAWIFVCLGCSGILLIVPGLLEWASLVLAASVALVTSRAIANRAAGFEALVRKTLPWVIALAAALGPAVYAWHAVPEFLARPVQAPREGPNVLLIVLDTVRAKSLQLHGYERETSPRLVQFAREGVVFERALATSPWTLPSHATFFTGRYAHELFEPGDTPLTGNVALQSPHPRLAEVMGSLGYEAAGFVGNVVYCDRGHGLHRGFSHYEDFPISLSWFFHSSTFGHLLYTQYRRTTGNREDVVRKTAVDVNDAFLGWLEDRGDRPFFAFLNYFDAHSPYVVPRPFEASFGSNRPPDTYRARFASADITPELVTQLQDGYDSCLVYLDHQIGLLLDELGRRGVLDNTLTIITSDHGELLGENGFLGHDNTVYRQVLQVPLVISYPSRIPVGMRVARPVSLRDIPATIMDLLGVETSPFPGSSLARHWNTAAAVADADSAPLFAEVLVGARKPTSWLESFLGYDAGLQALVANGYHYIRYRKDGALREELFDFGRDPEEESNLTDTDEGQRQLPDLRATLDRILGPSRR